MMELIKYWKQAGLIVVGVGVDRVNLGGNSDTVGMHMLRKIASLTEYMRNFSILYRHFNANVGVLSGISIRNSRIE